MSIPKVSTETAINIVVITPVNNKRTKEGSINLSKNKNGIIAETHDIIKHLPCTWNRYEDIEYLTYFYKIRILAISETNIVILAAQNTASGAIPNFKNKYANGNAAHKIPPTTILVSFK